MITLRHFTEKDAEWIQRHFYPDMQEEAVLDMIRDWNKGTFNGREFEMLAILEDQQAVGMISLYQHSATVASIGPEVMPEKRNRGIASEAMKLMIEQARRKGYRILSQQVRTNNTASRRLHEKLGFETDDYVYRNKHGHEVLIYLRAIE